MKENLLSIFPTGLNNDACNINHRMRCDRTTITFHIFKCVKRIKQCKSSIMAIFDESTKAPRIQSSLGPVWSVVAHVCLSLRFMLMRQQRVRSVAITHACPLRTLSNHHPAEGPSHTCDLPRLDSPTWGVRMHVCVFSSQFLAVYVACRSFLHLWTELEFTEMIISLVSTGTQCVFMCGKAGAKSVEKNNERDVLTATKFTCLGKTSCHV